MRESYRAKGLLVAHEGLLFDRQCLLHASTESRAAVLTDFADYFFRPRDPDPARVGRPRFDGAILYAVHEIGAVGEAGAGGTGGGPGGALGGAGSGQAGSAGTPGR